MLKVCERRLGMLRKESRLEICGKHTQKCNKDLQLC